MPVKSRRGMTLAELMVAIALVAVVASMAVSFTIMISHRTRVTSAHDAIRQDCQKLEACVEAWLNAISESGSAVVLPAALDGPAADVLEAERGEGEGKQTFSLRFSYNSLVGTLPDGKSITIRTDCIKSVSFEMLKNDETGDQLFFCHVVCEHDEIEKTVTRTFCVNPRVGEKGGA